MQKLDFWFEFASTYSYLSVMRARDLVENYDVELVYRPFLLGPVFAKQGLKNSPFILQEDKNRYMRADIGRIAEDRGLKFQVPETFPVNGVLAARVALVGVKEAWGVEFVEQAYLAHFAEGKDLSDVKVLEQILVNIVPDTDDVLARAVEVENKEALKSQTSKAMELGIFGAPTFTTAKGTLFWGDDRFEQALRYAVEGK